MKSFLTRHAAAIIATVLIVIIAVLALMAFRPTKESVSPQLEDLSNTVILPSNETTPTYVRTMPKSPVPSDRYLYTQELYGIGNISAKNLHITAQGIYIIAETDCIDGDICAQKPTVGIALCDVAGNVNKTYSVPTTSACRFVSSQITAVGIAVITACSDNKCLYVNLVDYELNTVKNYRLPYAEKVKIMSTNEGFLVFCESESGGVIYSYEKNFAFVAFDISDAIRIFEYGNRYTVVGNTAEGYSIVDIKKDNFSIIKEKKIPDKKIYDLIPLAAAEQVFIAIECGDGVYASKLDADLNVIKTARIGANTVTGTGTDGEKIYLGVKGNIDGIVTIDGLLSIVYSTTEDYSPAVILDSAFINGVFYMVTKDATGRTAVVKYVSDTSIQYIDETDEAFFTPNGNGTFTVVANGKFFDYSCVKIYGISI